MDKTINLKSRGRNNVLKKLTPLHMPELSQKTYILKTDAPILRTGYVTIDDGTEQYFVDPPGGPMIITGCEVPGIPNEIVHAINFYNNMCLITFKQ